MYTQNKQDPMKVISWNVNGINACIKKGLLNFIKKENADIYCFQEVKSTPCIKLKNYHQFYLPSKKKGYSGLLTLTKIKPTSIIKNMENKEIDKEARLLTLEFDNFFLINAYFPHARRRLTRLKFKLKFNKLFS